MALKTVTRMELLGLAKMAKEISADVKCIIFKPESGIEFICSEQDYDYSEDFLEYINIKAEAEKQKEIVNELKANIKELEKTKAELVKATEVIARNLVK
jgi:hypothetical protein